MRNLLLAVFVGLLCSTSAVAQKGGQNDGPIGIFGSRAEYDQFMGSAKRAAYGEGGNPELQAMIPMINDMVLQQPFGTTANQYNINEVSDLGLLADPKVREEIEMVDEQYEELQKLNADIQARAASQIQKLDFSDREGLVDRLREIRERAQEDLDSMFIPEQLARLRQLRNQSRMRGGRTLVDLLTTDPLRNELDISESQADELRELEKEVEEEIQREIAKLREKAKERLLSPLDSEQREQVEELFGETMAFTPRDREVGKGKARGKRGRK